MSGDEYFRADQTRTGVLLEGTFGEIIPMNNEWKHVDVVLPNIDLGDPSVEAKKYWINGAGRFARVMETGKLECNSSISGPLQNGRMLAWAFGHDTQSSTVLSGSTVQGHTIIVTGGDDTYTTGETGCLPSFNLLSYSDRSVSDKNLVRRYRGSKIKTLALESAEASELKATFEVQHKIMSQFDLGEADTLAPIVETSAADGTASNAICKSPKFGDGLITSVDPFQFYEASVTAFGTSLGRVTSFGFNLDNKLKAKWYHTAATRAEWTGVEAPAGDLDLSGTLGSNIRLRVEDSTDSNQFEDHIIYLDTAGSSTYGGTTQGNASSRGTICDMITNGIHAAGLNGECSSSTSGTGAIFTIKLGNEQMGSPNFSIHPGITNVSSSTTTDVADTLGLITGASLTTEGSDSGRWLTDLIEGKAEMTARLTVVPSDPDFLKNLVLNDSSDWTSASGSTFAAADKETGYTGTLDKVNQDTLNTDISIVVTFAKRGGAGGLGTEKLTLTLGDCILKTAPHKVPEENEITVDMEFEVRTAAIDLYNNYSNSYTTAAGERIATVPYKVRAVTGTVSTYPTVKWLPPVAGGNIAGYKIYRKDGSTPTSAYATHMIDVLVGEDLASAKTSNGTVSYTDYGVTSSATYIIIPYNEAGVGTASTITQVS